MNKFFFVLIFIISLSGLTSGMEASYDFSVDSVGSIIEKINTDFNYELYYSNLCKRIQKSLIKQELVLSAIDYVSSLLELVDNSQNKLVGTEKFEFNQRIMPFKAKYQKLLRLLQIKLQQP